jgi:hypothetical protein
MPVFVESAAIVVGVVVWCVGATSGVWMLPVCHPDDYVVVDVRGTSNRRQRSRNAATTVGSSTMFWDRHGFLWMGWASVVVHVW